MFKMIRNYKKVMSFIKQFKSDIILLKDNIIVITPVIEDLKKLVKSLEF